MALRFGCSDPQSTVKTDWELEGMTRLVRTKQTYVPIKIRFGEGRSRNSVPSRVHRSSSISLRSSFSRVRGVREQSVGSYSLSFRSTTRYFTIQIVGGSSTNRGQTLRSLRIFDLVNDPFFIDNVCHTVNRIFGTFHLDTKDSTPESPVRISGIGFPTTSPKKTVGE
jgi:hypothetical protein